MKYRYRRASAICTWVGLSCFMVASCVTQQPKPEHPSPMVGALEPSDVAVATPTSRPAILDESWARAHPPIVPTTAILANHHGSAVVMAQVGVDGKVLSTRVGRSTGYADLDESAESAVRNWRFQPCYKGDQPDVCWARAPVHFSPPNNPAARSLKLTITQPGVVMSPAKPPYSILWPRDENGQPLAGTTVVLARVEDHGEVVDVQIDRSSGFKSLDAAAQEGVRRWHFKPAYKNGLPTEAFVRVPVVMDMNGPGLSREPVVAPFPRE